MAPKMHSPISDTQVGSFILDCMKVSATAANLAKQVEALDDQAQALLYDFRFNNHLCVDCGKPVNEDVPGAEYCDACYDESKAIHDDIFRDLEQDRKIS